jgi:hypothetical protein
MGRLDGDAAIITALLDLYDFAYFRDDSGKHKSCTS